MLLFLVICFILTFLTSLLISSAEIAIGSISRDSVEKLVDSDIRGALLMQVMVSNRRRYRLMFVLGRIISIVGGTVCIVGILLLMGTTWGIGSIGTGFVVFIIALLAFTLSESICSRIIATGEYETTVARFAPLLIIFYGVLLPLIYLLDRILSMFIERDIELAVKEEALMELVKSEGEEGVIEKEEQEMIEGVLTFADKTVREVMVPRIDVVAVEKGISIDNFITLIQNEQHSRIPVYDGRIDNIIGVIYVKDILPIFAKEGKEKFSLTNHMRKPYYVTENKNISDLLKEFKKSKIHIGIVKDEYGGTSGIVALEDLLEEIVGDIQDEYDQEDHDYTWIDERRVLLDASLTLGEVSDILHTTIQSEDFDTLGGFIYNQLGVIPKGGEIIMWDGITFTVQEIIGKRILKVLVTGEKEFRDNENI